MTEIDRLCDAMDDEARALGLEVRPSSRELTVPLIRAVLRAMLKHERGTIICDGQGDLGYLLTIQNMLDE